MSKNKAHRLVITFITIACLGLLAESVLERWEFWVLPIIAGGIVALWVLHITQKMDERYRENCYLLYAIFMTLFHGVHETSFFDVVAVIALLLVTFSLLDHIYMLNLILTEYVAIMAIQFWLAARGGSVLFDSLNISRVALHGTVVICLYLLCRASVNSRTEVAEEMRHRDQEIEQYDNDMEDFLSNISHELRTPINAVNGMSMLLLKQGAGAEAEAIREAGIRLSYQVEDIQDYTEIKRDHVIVEEENYMTTSLVNDIVAGFRRYEAADELELVVDLDPNVPTMMRGDIRKLHKIFRHLLDNAVKFTSRGGINIRIYSIPQAYGVNLCVELTDTGRGMTRKDIAAASRGMYQANKQRNRSTGGIGLGLPVVYGLSHAMGGFVKIESERGRGTTVRVTIPQAVVNDAPCLKLDAFKGDILFHVRSEKYKVPQVREFNRAMAVHLALGLKAPLYSAETVAEVERLRKKLNVTCIFMGQEEYEANPAYFDELSRRDTVVAVSARTGFRARAGSRVVVMPKPLYGIPVTRLLNDGQDAVSRGMDVEPGKPVFDGVRTLVVDDEPMNLIVATGLFRNYKMVTETADSGAEAIQKYRATDYDVIFMDHMMPEMDGVETMKRLRDVAKETGRSPVIVALTANAVSGAREMFLREGFDGFIAKPIDVGDFERVMKRVLPESMVSYQGGDAT